MGAKRRDAEGLRRRLYARDASGTDVTRYLAAGSRSAGIARRWAVAVAGALALVTAVAIAVPMRPGPAPSGAAAGSGGASATPQGVHEVLPTRPQVDAFVAALRRGDDAGLARWFTDTPRALPPELRTLTRADTEEYRGSGDGAVVLSPSALAEQGGRITVIVVADRPTRLTWSAGPVVRTLRLSPGVPVSATADYRSPAPRSLTVTAAADARWGATVTFSA